MSKHIDPMHGYPYELVSRAHLLRLCAVAKRMDEERVGIESSEEWKKLRSGEQLKRHRLLCASHGELHGLVLAVGKSYQKSKGDSDEY